MKRKVIRVTNVVCGNARGTKGSNFLMLECGHEERRKGSERIPEFCNCRECAVALERIAAEMEKQHDLPQN
jgi:hypothetical protein